MGRLGADVAEVRIRFALRLPDLDSIPIEADADRGRRSPDGFGDGMFSPCQRRATGSRSSWTSSDTSATRWSPSYRRSSSASARSSSRSWPPSSRAATSSWWACRASRRP